MRVIIRKTKAVLLLYLGLTLLLAGCSSAAPAEATPTIEEIILELAPSHFEVELNIAEAPGLNEPVEITMTVVASYMDIPDTHVWIVLPEGIVLAEGVLDWTSDFIEDQPQTFQTTIMVISYGDWEIKGRAQHIPDEYNSWGGIGYVYLHITEEESYIGAPPYSPPTAGPTITPFPIPPPHVEPTPDLPTPRPTLPATPPTIPPKPTYPTTPTTTTTPYKSKMNTSASHFSPRNYPIPLILLDSDPIILYTVFEGEGRCPEQAIIAPQNHPQLPKQPGGTHARNYP